MAEEPEHKAENLAQHLEQSGKAEHAAGLRAALRSPVDGVMMALREACQSLLTAFESIDPTTETLIEELRSSVESRIRIHHK